MSATRKKEKRAPKLGTYSPGVEAVDQILRAAIEVLVDDGYSCLSLRNVADRCGMKIGNLTYYFPTKDLLIDAMLAMVTNDFRETANEIYADERATALEKLQSLLAFWLKDIQTPRGTRLYTELWAMANHNESAARMLSDFYDRGHQRMSTLVKQINPALSEQDCLDVTVYISSQLEGVIVFCGYERRWSPRMPQVAAIVIAAVTHTVRTITPGDIAGLPGPR